MKIFPSCKAIQTAAFLSGGKTLPGQIDHQPKTYRIQASLFTPLESEKQRLEQRLSQLRQQLNEPPAPLPVTTIEPKCTAVEPEADEEYGAVACAKMQRGNPRREILP